MPNKITLVNVGQYGSNNDSEVLAQSKISRNFENNNQNLPERKVLPVTILDISYFLVGDEIFLSKPWPLRPYPGRLLQLMEIVYSYRHSTAKSVIENAFAIPRAYWRIFSHSIKASVQSTERYVMACLCVHNYLRQTKNTHPKALLMPNWWMVKLRKENVGHRPGKMVA